jgi:hypothetical protein
LFKEGKEKAAYARESALLVLTSDFWNILQFWVLKSLDTVTEGVSVFTKYNGRIEGT